MESIPIVISGSGSMGRQVALAAAVDPGTTPLAFIDALSQEESCEGLPLYREAALALDTHMPEVVVDFSNAEWTPVIARAALERGIRLVIGTTGLPADFLEELQAEAKTREVGVVLAPNFAIGAILLMHFARQAAKFFDNAEIIELHHAGKVDAPSGTAKTTAEQMVQARGKPFERVEADFQTVPGTRGGEVDGVTLHSVRLPGLVAHQEVLFGGLGQTLSLRHDSTGRDSFMPGVLAAVKAVREEQGLVVGLEKLFGLS
tara:strand:+ start:49 stop:828 length:780 start_codon:yes stop_codon:yes gene_type:complete